MKGNIYISSCHQKAGTNQQIYISRSRLESEGNISCWGIVDERQVLVSMKIVEW